MNNIPPNCTLFNEQGTAKVNLKLVLPAENYTIKFKRRQDGVCPSDLLKYVGISVERVDGTSGESQQLLNCAASTTHGVVSVLHDIGSYHCLKEDEKSDWNIGCIPTNVTYVFRNPRVLRTKTFS